MSKRKRHSINKRHATYSRALLHRMGAVVVWIAGQHDNKCVLAHLKTGKLITMDRHLAGAISDVQHDWSIYCAAFGRQHDGSEYMKGDVVIAPRCYQSQIADELSDIHTRILRDMNPKHRVGLGWIACPWGEDLDEATAAKLFDQLGGWDAHTFNSRNLQHDRHRPDLAPRQQPAYSGYPVDY
jgi:hypothetical protein